jgi:hypothetical protein
MSTIFKKAAGLNEIQGELERRLQHLEEALQRQDNAIIELKALLSLAADRIYMWVDAGLDPSLETKELIAELRKAAQ